MNAEPEMTNVVTLATPESIAIEVKATIVSFFESHAQLAVTLRHENNILKAREMGSLSELMVQKGAQIENYQSKLRYLQHNATVVKTMSQEIKEKLTEMRAEMAKLTTQNMQLIERAMKSNERTTRMIVDAMQAAKRSSTFYGKSGSVADAAETSRSFAVDSVV